MVTHHARLNLIMLATIVGLVAFLYFRPQSQNAQEYPIATHSMEAVQNLRIIRHKNEIVLKRSNDRWDMTEPVQVRGDENKINEVLKILTASSYQRFPLTDLGRFSLNQPNIQLYIDNKYFGFGGFAPTTNQQYVATDDYVYLVSPRYAMTLPVSATDLISPLLIAPHAIPTQFKLNHLTIESQNGHWQRIAQNSEETLNEKAMKHWIQLWRTLRASALTLNQKFGTDFIETDFIHIRLQDAQEINLKVLQNETELVLLLVSEGIGYHFPIDVGRQFLDPHALISNQILPEN